MPEDKNSARKTNPGKNKTSYSRLRMGIRRHLTLLILLLFLPLLALESFSAWQEYDNQREAVLQSQAATARSVSRTVTAFINDQQNTNRALGLNFVNSIALDTDQGNAILRRYRTSVPYLFSYRWLNPSGKVLYADPPPLVGKDLSQDPSFKQVVEGAEEAVGDLRLSEVDNSTPIFSVVSRIYSNDGNLLGIISASIDTTRIGQVLEIKIGAKGRGSLSIHDRQANLIYNSQFPNLSYQNRLNKTTESVNAALQGHEMVLPFVKSNLDGVDKMGASVPITKMGWSASIAEPIEDAMAPTTSIVIPRLITFIIVALAAVLAAWLYSLYLARPLIELRLAAHEFGQGNMDRRVRQTNHKVTEMEELALSFNQMAGKIAQENKARDAFLAQAAHELKTPVTIIKGISQVVARKQKKAMQQALQQKNPSVGNQEVFISERLDLLKQLDKVEYQSNRMTELINRLLELTRMQSGRIQYHFEQVNFLQLLEKCLEAAVPLTRPELHTLTFSAPENPPSVTALETGDATATWEVHVDRARIEQVILNLLENAIKYSPHGGTIRVTLLHHEAGDPLDRQSLELRIQDDGLGIAADELERLFERYYRAQNMGHNISGLGLGLYISAQIVRQHKGRLWATSPGPGQGSTFHMLLPLQQAAEKVEADALSLSPL